MASLAAVKKVPTPFSIASFVRTGALMCRAAQVLVLVPITAGSEPVEAFVPIAVLRRAGADVTVAAAGAGAGLRVHAMYGVTVVADANVADCADASYDLVALPVRTHAVPIAHADAVTNAHDAPRTCAGRRPRRGQPRRLRGAGEHREAPGARGRPVRRHLRRAAAGAGALGPARRRQGDLPAMPRHPRTARVYVLEILLHVRAGNCASGVRGQVPGGGGRRGRERGGRRQGSDGAWPGAGHGVRARSRGTALRQGQG